MFCPKKSNGNFSNFMKNISIDLNTFRNIYRSIKCINDKDKENCESSKKKVPHQVEVPQ